EEAPLLARADERVAVGEALAARDEEGEEALGVRVAPQGLRRTEGPRRLAREPPPGIEGQLELVDRAVLLARALRPVVEDPHVARAGEPGGDPLGLVLVEELSIGLGAAPVVARIAPAVEQVAALLPGTAARPARLCGGGRVIDDPDLVE